MYPLKGFVYGKVEVEPGGKGEKPMLVRVEMREDRRIQGRCGKCGAPGPCYDHLKRRPYDFVPLWSIPVVLFYARRRIACPRCGIRAERLDWTLGKSPVTVALAWFLAMWAKETSWLKVSKRFTLSWHKVYESVKYAVEWGMAHRDLSGVTAIGVDELSYGHGQKYLTLVYQIDHGCRRLLWIGRDRTEDTLRCFFKEFGGEFSRSLRYVCSDMWKAYLNVIAEYAVNALNILDRFHIMMHMSETVDEVRRDEVRRLKAEKKDAVLSKSRWCFLKRPENLTEKQSLRLGELLGMNLRTVKAYMLKESFQLFWEYTRPSWAGRYLDGWCRMAMRSQMEPMKKFARMVRSHRELILNWFKALKELSSGIVEGMNNKARTRIKMAYGYRNVQTFITALFHQMGNLPVDSIAHRFF
jgi:transposase